MEPLPPVHVDIQPAMDTTYLQYKGVWDMQDLYEFVTSFFNKRNKNLA